MRSPCKASFHVNRAADLNQPYLAKTPSFPIPVPIPVKQLTKGGVRKLSLNFPVLLFNWCFLRLQSSHVHHLGMRHSGRLATAAQTSLLTHPTKLEPKVNGDHCSEFHQAETWHQKSSPSSCLQRIVVMCLGQRLELMT